MIAPALHDNRQALQQGIALLRRLSPAKYTQRTPVCFNSSAGGHFRHVIEHYLSFLQGLETGEVDYETRARDPLIESDPAYALAQLESIGERLHAVVNNPALRVRAECSVRDADVAWCASSVVRELEFLLSHTIHHYALIGVICQLSGQVLPPDFGMAPSTLRYLQAQSAAACAR